MAQLNKPQYKIVVDNTIHIFKKVEKADKFIKNYCMDNKLEIQDSYVNNLILSLNLMHEDKIVLRYEKIHFESELITLN